MTVDVLTNTIQSCLNDVVFIYNGKQSGITSSVNNYQSTFQVWYGDQTKNYDKIDDVLNDKFYGGKSLIDLLDMTEFTIL